MTTKLTIRTERGKMGGYFGRVVCVMHNGQWLWSERAAPERVNREDARIDAQWLKEQHQRMNHDQ